MSYSIAAVTTCHAAGWEQYGRRMAKTWVDNWPVPLWVYGEGFRAADDTFVQQSSDLHKVAPWLAKFKAEHPYKRPGVYDYRFDAARFAHKVAAVVAAAEACLFDYLIWVDADTVTHQPVPMEFVEFLLPQGDEYIAWLDRRHKYPECGFFILNCRHPRHAALIAAFKDAYTTGSLFKMAEWHDSYVLEQLVLGMGLLTRSLSGEAGYKTSHPFINGPLGAYMDHLKGPRKNVGRSHARDIKVARTEPYWSKK